MPGHFLRLMSAWLGSCTTSAAPAQSHARGALPAQFYCIHLHLNARLLNGVYEACSCLSKGRFDLRVRPTSVSLKLPLTTSRGCTLHGYFCGWSVRTLAAYVASHLLAAGTSSQPSPAIPPS